MILWQSRHEEILRTHLQKVGVEVEWGVEMEGFEQHADHVSVTLKRTISGVDTVETTTTPYLLSAEGAHSIVRKKLDLGFYGETTSQSYIIGDIEVLDGINRDVCAPHKRSYVDLSSQIFRDGFSAENQ